MMSVYIINFCLTFPAVLTLCFAIPDLADALSEPSGYPAVYVLRQSMSDGWVTVVLVVIIVLLLCSNVSYLTAVTRDLFAFGRDGGLPLSGWISKVTASLSTVYVLACVAYVWITFPILSYYTRLRRFRIFPVHCRTN